MPVTVKFDPHVTQPQAQIIPDATQFNDGVMTKAQAAKLASLTPGPPVVSLAAGFALFTTGDPLVVSVLFLAPVLDIYVPQLSVGFFGADAGGLPNVRWSDLTPLGFNINLQADPGFDFIIGWSLQKATQ